jgi:hypothetical protein
MTDRYTKTVLTVIAVALVYICVVITPLPAVSAQQASLRPGEPTGPAEVTVVGWRQDVAVPITFAQPLRVIEEPGAVKRVVITGWEENASPGTIGGLHALDAKHGVPVIVTR